MKQIMLRRWLGVFALGSSIVLGCSHAGKQCTNCMMGGTAEPPMLSTTESPGEVLTPVVHTTAEPPMAQTRMEVQQIEQPHGKVLTPVTAPGGAVGMVEMDSRDADRIGVKPGQTPGAIMLPESMPLSH